MRKWCENGCPEHSFTQQGVKPACHEDITVNFSHLPLAQLPRTTLTHSKAPNQTRMPGRNQRKFFAAPIGAATPNTVYTLHTNGAKPPCQEDIIAKLSQLPEAFKQRRPGAPQLPPTQVTHSKLPNPHARSQLLLAQLPRTQFTQSKLPNPHSRKTSP